MHRAPDCDIKRDVPLEGHACAKVDVHRRKGGDEAETVRTETASEPHGNSCDLTLRPQSFCPVSRNPADMMMAARTPRFRSVPACR